MEGVGVQLDKMVIDKAVLAGSQFAPAPEELTQEHQIPERSGDGFRLAFLHDERQPVCGDEMFPGELCDELLVAGIFVVSRGRDFFARHDFLHF